ncbi:LysR family transcriptional regulator [Phyllobacterium chamaecytisi]|uniref:LysR family transcriptional regulator n=1 Tax=Phyllobacterium chamaecytisi TaxID=2876082 RepID=UPI001CCE5577|nr:LysR family transcriptional regulator [Phyllobacterium sp. KW56]MBZ9602986.1 LysR family transcriptional regulator [Phyllobacterium sp. KW56]
MPPDDKFPPLNSIRVFLTISREGTVTKGAAALGITQSGASRHLAVLEDYLGGRLFTRRGREIELTELGRLFGQATADALDTIDFTSRRMRQKGDALNGLVVRTSLPTFAYSTLIPNLQDFCKRHDASVDIVTSLAPPKANDVFDVLITRDLDLRGATEQWLLVEENIICVGSRALVQNKSLIDLLTHAPVISVTSRPDILPRWSNALGLPLNKFAKGPRYDHHFLAIPAAVTGQGLLIVPEILVADLVTQEILDVVPNSRAKSGMQYHAYSLDRGANFELARSFCRWMIRTCRTATMAANT